MLAKVPSPNILEWMAELPLICSLYYSIADILSLAK